MDADGDDHEDRVNKWIVRWHRPVQKQANNHAINMGRLYLGRSINLMVC